MRVTRSAARRMQMQTTEEGENDRPTTIDAPPALPSQTRGHKRKIKARDSLGPINNATTQKIPFQESHVVNKQEKKENNGKSKIRIKEKPLKVVSAATLQPATQEEEADVRDCFRALAAELDSMQQEADRQRTQQMLDAQQPNMAQTAAEPMQQFEEDDAEDEENKKPESIAPAPDVTLSPRTLLVPGRIPPTCHASDLPPAATTAIASNPAPDATAAPAPSTTPAVPLIDHRHALPAPYVTINPDLLREAAWSFRDLQLLAMRLGLGGRGTRAELVDKLQAWHRAKLRRRRSSEREEAEDDHPLSIRKRMKNASNFSLLQLDTQAMMNAAAAAVQATPAAPSTSNSASSLSPDTPLSPPSPGSNLNFANGPSRKLAVATSLPQLLTPLMKRPAARTVEGTPRSIVRRTPMGSPGLGLGMASASAKKKRLSFSVLNGVKLIPSRHTAKEDEMNRTPSPIKQDESPERDEVQRNLLEEMKEEDEDEEDEYDDEDVENEDSWSQDSESPSQDSLQTEVDKQQRQLPSLPELDSSMEDEFKDESESTSSTSTIMNIDVDSTCTPEPSPSELQVTPPSESNPSSSPPSSASRFLSSVSNAILNVFSPRRRSMSVTPTPANMTPSPSPSPQKIPSYLPPRTSSHHGSSSSSSTCGVSPSTLPRSSSSAHFNFDRMDQLQDTSMNSSADLDMQ